MALWMRQRTAITMVVSAGAESQKMRSSGHFNDFGVDLARRKAAEENSESANQFLIENELLTSRQLLAERAGIGFSRSKLTQFAFSRFTIRSGAIRIGQVNST